MRRGARGERREGMRQAAGGEGREGMRQEARGEGREGMRREVASDGWEPLPNGGSGQGVPIGRPLCVLCVSVVYERRR